jgi:putative ABC transport system ATP-binding protein
MQQPVIEIRDLYKRILHGQSSLEILAGISLQIAAGEFVAVRGPSGSGKSTLLGLIAGLDRPTSGSIRIAGREISSLSEDDLARLRRHTIGIVFQSYQLIATLTAFENVVLPHQLAGGSLREGVDRANSLLDQVGLASRSDHYPRQLSGGEQQRVALARAFMLRPDILLADEPTGNLDSQNGKHILSLMASMNRQHGTTLVLVTHDPILAGSAERQILLNDGRIATENDNMHATIS